MVRINKLTVTLGKLRSLGTIVTRVLESSHKFKLKVRVDSIKSKATSSANVNSSRQTYTTPRHSEWEGEVKQHLSYPSS
jgi:hypothetical protein